MIRKVTALLFLVAVVGAAVFLVASREKAAQAVGTQAPAPAPAGDLHPAKYFRKLPGDAVHCLLCPNACKLSDGQIGLCKVRKNVKGELYTLSYGQVASLHVDPIEKKPLFHVLPGTKAFSLATPGCNLRCLFCQNWEISQAYPWDLRTTPLTPEQVVEAALRSGARSVAFTYNEPTIFFEYMLDIAKLARAKGLKTAVISNGFINRDPLKELLPYIDAYKVDLKAFSEEFYAEMTGGKLASVLETLKTIRESGVWLEIVTLLIPGKNDGEAEIRALAKWVRENLGDDVPVHFSRFHPMYKLLNLPPTPVETVVGARRIAMEEGLKYVYTGNIAFPEGEATYSPKSGEPAIVRRGYFIVKNSLEHGVAPDGERIPGVWE